MGFFDDVGRMAVPALFNIYFAAVSIPIGFASRSRSGLARIGRPVALGRLVVRFAYGLFPAAEIAPERLGEAPTARIAGTRRLLPALPIVRHIPRSRSQNLAPRGPLWH